ncbi:hypothetical protein UTI89_C2153 [Escherichia coli UTI89]|uniref:Uncharacterized protein n=2 Tax=Escherichia coli TaxID=562 RepID=A0A0H2Z010_ECOK1|nr:hypothetical protein UTI89_C2153 [Escherichia coli UTI89]ABJ01291.1 conserved hypothetical protein [Escherichia coli APEC O1]
MPCFIKEPDAERVVFQRNQVHCAFTKLLNCQYHARTTRTAIRFDCYPIIHLHRFPPVALCQCRTISFFWQRQARASVDFLDGLYLKDARRT